MFRFITVFLIGVLLTAMASPVATAGDTGNISGNISGDDPGKGGKGVVAYRGGTILTGTGTSIPGGVLLVKDGKILAVGAGVRVPAGARIVDLHNRVLMPGLVNPLTYLAHYGRDDEESVSPDVRAADGIDLFARNRELLRGGVTAWYVAPGRARLLSGTGAVARSAGKPETRILRASAGMRLNLGERDLAYGAYQKSTETDPTNKPAHLELATMYVQDGHHQMAIPYYEQIRRLGPETPNDNAELRFPYHRAALDMLVLCYTKVGDDTKAEFTLKEIKVFYPTFVRTGEPLARNEPPHN